MLRNTEKIPDGFSKNKFPCCICKNFRFAHEFTVRMNKFCTRELRIICKSCVPVFNILPQSNKIELVRRRLEEHYGEEQFIYGLFEPTNFKLKYIGRARDIKRRYQSHLQQAREYQKKLESLAYSENKLNKSFYSSKKWIADLIKQNLRPKMEILQQVKSNVKVCEQEMRWICQSIKEKEDILNAENFSKQIKKLIISRKFSFKEVSMDLLIASNFISQMDLLTTHLGHESGWRKAVLIHNVYKESIELLAR